MATSQLRIADCGLRNRPRRRRGVILLVAMAMLALFSVIVLAFVLVARQHKQAANAMLQGKFHDDNYEEKLDQAALQVLRGTNNPLSVIGPHSLLEDVYASGAMEHFKDTNNNGLFDPGEPYVDGNLNGRYDVGPLSGTVFVTAVGNTNNSIFTLFPTLTFTDNTTTTSLPESLRGYYNGRLITLFKGGAVQTYRVIDFAAPEPFVDANGNGVYDMGDTLTDTNGNGTWDASTSNFTVITLNGEYTPDKFGTNPNPSFVLNGRSFAGPGFGFYPPNFADTNGANDLLNFGAEPFTDNPPLNGQYDLGETFTDVNGNGVWDGAIALMPNPRAYDYQNYLQGKDAAGNRVNIFPVANEDYDGADYQNMLLAFVRAHEGTTAADAFNSVPIPSLHRPALINYWTNVMGGAGNFSANTPAAAALRRRVILRPDTITDHPNFPTINVLNGPWDVDNDGDGQNDSIWVDLGLPPQTTRDGRQFKPLFAILCLDMDGKLNLNEHGTLNDWNNDFAEGVGSSYYSNPWKQLVTLTRPANSVPPSTPELAGTAGLLGRGQLPVGLGHGPMETSLSMTLTLPAILPGAPPAPYYALLDDTEFRQLKRGFRLGTGRAVEGVYGEGHLLPNVADNTNFAPILPGVTGQDDNVPPSTPPAVTGYNIPLDVDGGGVLGMGPDGQPRFTYMGTPNGAASLPETTDEASELDPPHRSKTPKTYPGPTTRWANVDNRITPHELEDLLRRRDVDSGTLPQRLRALSPSLYQSGFGTNPNYNAARVTTESWDIPVPAFTPTPEIHYGLDIYNYTLTPVSPAEVVDYGGVSILDLVRGKIVAVDRQSGGAPKITTKAQVDAHVATLISQNVIAPELVAGLRMNLNRRFNEPYRDVNNNGNYDAAEPYVDVNGNGSWDAELISEKRTFAKQLYFLMMLLKDFKYSHFIDTTMGTGFDQEPANVRPEVTARQLAQWAINVVEYRDSDLTMTAFKYVVNPFKCDPTAPPPPTPGWNLVEDDFATPAVDEYVTTDETTLMPTNPNYNTERRMVWGCEDQVLVLTENVNFHDRRVEDLTDGGGTVLAGTDTNGDFDQRRMPQGSSFFELYCTRNANNPVLPSQDLFSGSDLDLGKMAGGNPVWRLAISDISSSANNNNDVTARLKERPYTTSLDPENLYPGETPIKKPDIDRVVWFAAPPGASVPSNTSNPPVYYNRAAAGSNVRIPGGRYVVVGPSRTTATATRQNDNVTILGWTGGAPAPQEIQLGAAFQVTDNANGYSVPPPANVYPTAETQPAISVAVAADHFDPMNWALGPIGISISEPKPRAGQNYYPNIPAPAAANQTTYAQNGGVVFNDVYGTVQSSPLDTTATMGVANLNTGTKEKIRTVFLQRLADPLANYDPVANPYVTVDWMPMDLQVFNGQVNAPVAPAMGFDSLDPQRGTAGNVKFASRQRGVPLAPAPGGSNELWTAVSELPASAPTGAPTGTFTRMKNLDHTLGYLNKPWHDPSAPDPTWKFLTSTNPYGPAFRGSPTKPFPWLAWANRPYVSQFQLMNVPASSPSRLGWEYCAFDPSGKNFYNDQTGARGDGDRGGMGPPPAVPLLGTPFGHLLNFFHSSEAAVPDFTVQNGAANEHNKTASNYYRLFDYVEVPSSFTAAQTAVDPINMPVPYNGLSSRLSTFRYPGLVNANTICDDQDRTWLGVTNSFNSVDGANPKTPIPFAGGNATWSAVRQCRQGYDVVPNYMTLNNGIPTMFARPFRSMGGANYAPLATLRSPNGNELIESTFLRRTNGTGPNKDEPLFSFLSKDGAPGYDDMSLDTDSDGTPDVVPIRGHFNNSEDNPYFRYLMYQKLGNTLTTRSNVYAVWITVGYFEVLPHAIDAGHPDGYELQAEMVNQAAGVQRHKIFMLADRSIPVAFVRGENLNVGQTVLVLRKVE